MPPAAQLLVVSPDHPVLQAAQRCLLLLGHAPFLARTITQARRTLGRVQVDLLCLDSILPRSEVEGFWRWLAATRGREPLAVILLAPPSAKLAPATLPAFFQPQRDGLVRKPLDSEELAQEVTRLLAARPRRRRSGDLLRVGGVALVTQQLLFDDGGAVPLTPLEYRFLRYLMERPGEFIPVEELLEQVWDCVPGTGGPEVVRSHVSNIRRKLRDLGDDRPLLRTLPYQGYGFILDETPHARG